MKSEITVLANKQLDIERVNVTQNENDVTIIDLKVPDIYKDFNKKIVYELDKDKIVWDLIEDDQIVIKKEISKYEKVDFYIWLTRGENEDFRSETKTINFYKNKIVTEEITPEELDNFNRVIRILGTEITKVENLKVEVEELEDKLEQAEKLRDEKVENAVEKITDMTESYNKNAQEKIEEFNENSETEIKKYNENAEEKLSDYNKNDITKLDEYNKNSDAKLNDYNKNTIDKVNEYNENADEKKEELETIADGVRDLATAIQFATFEINDNMELIINQSEKLGNTNFSINENGELEVAING